MSEYPKQMRFVDGDEVTVVAGPDCAGYHPALFPHGRYGLAHQHNLSPLPSPDDEVEVVVKMTREQRDAIADWFTPAVNCEWFPVRSACLAHRDAEGCPSVSSAQEPSTR